MASILNISSLSKRLKVRRYVLCRMSMSNVMGKFSKKSSRLLTIVMFIGSFFFLSGFAEAADRFGSLAISQ